MVTEAGQLRNRNRPDAAADAFDTECSTLSPADRQALIGETAQTEDEHENKPPQHQHNHNHNHHHHHPHHHHHDHYEHPHPDDVSLAATDDDTKLRAIGAKTPIMPSDIGTDYTFKRQIVWPNAIGFAVLHALALYGLALTVLNYPLFKTTLYSLALIYGSGLGVTMGAHRLWSHRSFKARTPLRLFLLWLHTLAGQNCLYVWVRDHRQHHKYSDTDADPHNASRGFFFSHVGWLMSRKHPKVIEYGKKIDMSDLEADPWIMFQKRNYKMLYLIFSLLLPTAVPILGWGERPLYALFCCFFTRVVIQLNATWLVNSAAHLYGTRPFDKNILPVESLFVAFFAVGEGWHNYHHAFPWDYRASELGTPLNLTGFLIDLLARLGFAYDRKSASHGLVKSRVMRTGDASHFVYGSEAMRGGLFRTLFNMWRYPLGSLEVVLPPTEQQLEKETVASEAAVFVEQKQQQQPNEIAGVAESGSVSEGSCSLIAKLSQLITQDMGETGGAMSKSDLNLNVDDVFMVKLG